MENMQNSKLIVIEGPQGVGKTNLANYLRENIKSSNLYRLSGIPDKTKTGLSKNKEMYEGLISYLKTLENTGMNLIFDRTFFTEKVYSSLRLKDYNFDDAYYELLHKFLDLKFVKFDMENSVKQQEEYLKIADELKGENLKVLKIAMDDFTTGYNKINNILGIK